MPPWSWTWPLGFTDARSALPGIVTLVYVGVGLLVLAQILGIYALRSHKADLVFALMMAGLLVGAGVCGGLGAYRQLH